MTDASSNASKPAQKRRVPRVAAALAAVLVAAWFVGGCFGSPRHSGPVTDHFDGRHFFNPPYVGATEADVKSWTAFWKWRFTREPGTWPEHVEVEPARALAVPPPGALAITFVNHSTFLIQSSNASVLTDPVWSERVGPVSWAGPRRVHAPGIEFDALPKIDLVVISHDHYDHLDQPTIERLARRDQPLFLAGLGIAPLLEERGAKHVRALDWNESAEIAGVRATFVPARHWSGRWIDDRRNTLWGAFALEIDGQTLYFAGDTGFGPHFAAAAERFGAFDVAMLPIGAYEPRWFMAASHVDPDEAVRAHLALRARTSLGMHFGTFQNSDEARDAPVEDLARARERHGVPVDAFRALAPGATFVSTRR